LKKKRSVKAILERRKKKRVSHDGEVYIGKIVGTHGLSGELKVKSESDIFERQMELLEKLPIYRGVKREEFEIESVKPYKEIYLVKLRGIEERSSAEERIGGEIWVKREELPELEEGEFYYEELLGLKVVDSEGREIGRVKNIFEQPASHILEVESGEGKTILIPFIDEFVKEVLPQEGVIKVSLIEGMEE